LELPNKKKSHFDDFFAGTAVRVSMPCTWGYVHHPLEPLLPLRFHTRGQEGTNVPWNDEKVLQVEETNDAVGPSFDASLINTVNKNTEDSITANSTTPIPLMLCVSIRFTAAHCRSSRFLPSTSFYPTLLIVKYKASHADLPRIIRILSKLSSHPSQFH